jgi:hypothetical protein
VEKRLLLSLSTLLFFSHCFSQILHYHAIQIKGHSQVTLNGAVFNNNGFYLVGSADSLFYILNETGDAVSQWTQLIGTTGQASATGILSNYHGDLLACGYMTQSTGNKIYVIAGFDTNGDTLGTITLNDSLGDDFAAAVGQTYDTNFVLTGMGPSGLAVVVIGQNGIPISSNAYPPSLPDHNQKVMPVATGGFIISSNNPTTLNGALPYFQLLYFASNGNLIVGHKYEVTRQISAEALTATSDHGIVVAGSYTDSTTEGTVKRLMMVKLNSFAMVDWAYTYGDPVSTSDDFHSVIRTSDGGYAAYGSVGGPAYGGSDNVLLKTDSSGNVLWAKTYGLFPSDSGYVVNQSSSGYVLFGYGHDSTGAYIEGIVTDSMGNTSCHFNSIGLNQSSFTLTADTVNLTGTPLTGFSTLHAAITPDTTTHDTICPNVTDAPFTYHHLLDTTNIWHYAFNFCGQALLPTGNNSRSLNNCTDPGSRGIVYTGETAVINQNTYNKVIAQQLSPLVSVPGDSCLLGYIREDTTYGKIYFINTGDTSEILLYDFSMQPGDKIPITFANQYSNNSFFQSGVYTLDSIDNVNIAAGPRRVFYLNCHTCTGNTLTWTEGVGNLGDAIYPNCLDGGQSNVPVCGPYAQQCSGFPHNFYSLVTCFEHGQKVYFDTCAYQLATTGANQQNEQLNWTLLDSCDSYYPLAGINQLTSLSSLRVFPNPASNTATVQIELTESADLDIYVKNIEGKTIGNGMQLGILKPGMHNADLDLSDLSVGFYFIECRTKAGSLYRKLVIQK